MGQSLGLGIEKSRLHPHAQDCSLGGEIRVGHIPRIGNRVSQALGQALQAPLEGLVPELYSIAPKTSRCSWIWAHFLRRIFKASAKGTDPAWQPEQVFPPPRGEGSNLLQNGWPGAVEHRTRTLKIATAKRGPQKHDTPKHPKHRASSKSTKDQPSRLGPCVPAAPRVIETKSAYDKGTKANKKGTIVG